jgi:parvulin-like peptidyl-prolyl isomerase
MAKRTKKRKDQTNQRQTKKQIAISRRAARQNRIIYLSLAAVGLIVLTVVAIGVIQELVVRPSSPVGIVNGTKIRTNEFEDLLQYRRYNAHIAILNLQNQLSTLDPNDEGNEFMRSFYEQQLNQLQSRLALAPEETLDELIQDVLVQEKAAESGITVTDEDVTQSIQEDLKLAAAPPVQTPITDTQQLVTPTAVPQEELDEIYQNALSNMGLTDREFRNIVERGLYRSELQELMASQVPTTGLVVHVQLIQTDTEAKASVALDRVQAGEDFAIVAREVSSDTLTAEDGGDLGWITTGQLSSRYGEELEAAVSALGEGEIEKVDSGDRFYVVLLAERDENGPLPADVVSQQQATALSDWLAEREASPEVEIERLLRVEQIPPDLYESLGGARGP